MTCSALLVRRFSELLVVEATDREGVVSLRHRSDALDACHAVVDDLEPDARSWVRRQLDLAVSPQVPEAALTSDALVARRRSTRRAASSRWEMRPRLPGTVLAQYVEPDLENLSLRQWPWALAAV